MTRDEFNALPDGTVVESTYGTQLIKIGERGAYTNGDAKVRWVGILDHDLNGMTVVSTPALPTLEDADVVRDDDGGLWARGQEGWMEQDDLYTSLPESDDTLTTKYGPITILVPGPRA